MNIVITNNGNPADIAAQIDTEGNEISPAVTKDKVLRVTRSDGMVVDMEPGSCTGFDPAFSYAVEYIDAGG